MNSYFFGSRKREGSANSVKMSFAALPTNQSTSGGKNVRDEHAFSFLLQGSSMDVYVDDVGWHTDELFEMKNIHTSFRWISNFDR